MDSIKGLIKGLYKWYVEHVLRIKYPSEMPKEGDKLGRIVFSGMLIFNFLTIVLFVGWIFISDKYYGDYLNPVCYVLLLSVSFELLFSIVYYIRMKWWKWVILRIIIVAFVIYVLINSLYHLNWL